MEKLRQIGQRPRHAILLDKDGKPCPYCSRKMDVNSLRLRPTRDHIQARKRFNGKDIIITCSECNAKKGDKTIEEFITFLIAENMRFDAAMKVNNNRLIHLEYLFKMGLA